MPSDLPLSMSEAVALAACQYARAHIVEGSTQIKNNFYEPYERIALHRAILVLRDNVDEVAEYSSEFDPMLRTFNQTIRLCQKFHLGNCFEMSLMALHYVVQKVSPKYDINAEVFFVLKDQEDKSKQNKVDGHAFLVIGRDKKSNPSEPGSWGRGTFISDPWKDEVYPAADFLLKMNNYYYADVKGLPENCLEAFNPEQHSLSIFITADYILSAQKTTHLRKMTSHFKRKITNIINAIYNLQERLRQIEQQLQTLYGDDDKELGVVRALYQQLLISKEAIEVIFNRHDHKEEKEGRSYDLHDQELEASLKQALILYAQAFELKPEERSILANPREESSKLSIQGLYKYTTQLFFQQPSETAIAINKALAETKKELQPSLRARCI